MVCVLRRCQRHPLSAGERRIGGLAGRGTQRSSIPWALAVVPVPDQNGADPNQPLDDTGETPLHAALCKTSAGHDRTIRVLLAGGANPMPRPRWERRPVAFMRDARTKGETPLIVRRRLRALRRFSFCWMPARSKDAKDANGDSPLSWGSWHLRPDYLRKLCYGSFSIREGRVSMDVSLLGEPRS